MLSNGEVFCSKNLSFEKISSLPPDLSKCIIVSDSIDDKIDYNCADFILQSKMFSSALINIKSRSHELYLEFLEIADVKTKFIFSSLMSSKKIMNFLFGWIFGKKIYELDNPFYQLYCLLKQENLICLGRK